MMAANPYLTYLAALADLKHEIFTYCLNEHDLQVATFPEARERKRALRIEALKSMGMQSQEGDQSFYINGLALGGVMGKDSHGPRMAQAYPCQSHVINLGISGGEALRRPDEVYRMIRAAKHRQESDCYARLYTSGDNLTPEIAQTLRDVGLDEIRLGIKPGNFAILDKLRLARQYIPQVIVEGTVYPECGDYMRKLLLELNRFHIQGVNLSVLRDRANPEMFKRRGGQYPYQTNTLFDQKRYDQDGSMQSAEDTIFDLIEFAIRKKLCLSVHYCPMRQHVETTSRRTRTYESNIAARPHESVTEEGLMRKLIVFTPQCLDAAAILQQAGAPAEEIRLLGNLLLETHVKYRDLLNQYECVVMDCLPNGELAGLKILDGGSQITRADVTWNPLHFAEIGDEIFHLYRRYRGQTKALNPKVVERLRRGLQGFEQAVAPRLALFQILSQFGAPAAAVPVGETLLDSNYRTAYVYRLLLNAYQRLGDVSACTRVREEAMARFPDQFTVSDLSTAFA